MFRVNRGSRKSIPCGISHVFVRDKNLFWMHGVVDTFILTDLYGYWRAILANPEHFLIPNNEQMSELQETSHHILLQ